MANKDANNKLGNLGDLAAREAKNLKGNADDKFSNLGDMAAAAANDGNTTVYEVKKGDTLSAIGKRHGVSWKKIYEANRDVIKDPDLIHPGWKLKIPNK
jgi:nucleoid-associated protein YgaU